MYMMVDIVVKMKQTRQERAFRQKSETESFKRCARPAAAAAAARERISPHRDARAHTPTAACGRGAGGIISIYKNPTSVNRKSRVLFAVFFFKDAILASLCVCNAE